nr:hypothetical protein CFP56_79298 [Quercus suber]
MHLHAGLAERQVDPLQWTNLTELRVGNASLLRQSISLIGPSAPRLDVMQILQSSMPVQHCGNNSNADRQGEIWVDILPNHRANAHETTNESGVLRLRNNVTASSYPLQGMDTEYARRRRRSSMYSLASDQYVDGARLTLLEDEERRLDGVVSRSSRDVPIMLDLSPRCSDRRVA